MFRKKYGFPVGVEVDNVHLVKMNFHSFDKDHKYEIVSFQLRRGTKELKDTVFFPVEEDHPDVDRFMYKMVACKTILERVGITFLGKEVMAEVNRKAEGLDDYFNDMYGRMIDAGYQDQELIVKTTRDRKGFIRLAMWTDFIRRADDDSREFTYTEYEEKNVLKHQKSKEALGESNEPF